MTEFQMKKVAAKELEREFGFGQKPSEVVLLEASGDGTCIRFRVAGGLHEYVTRKRGEWMGETVYSRIEIKDWR